MKFLVAGFGSIGRRHFKNLKALGEDEIVFYRSGKGNLPDDELDGLIIEKDISAALSHRPDAVIVANPTAFHLDVAIPAAEAGCHLLIEKPISNSVDRIDELRAAVEKKGCRVLVGYQFRFHPTLMQAKEIIESGELGNPISAQVSWGEYLPDWHPWEDYRQSYSARSDLGGGVTLTLSHPFDYLRWLFGKVRNVSGHARRSGQLMIDVEDEADAELEFENGVKASVHLDYLRKPASHWLEIKFSNGKMHWDGSNGLLIITKAVAKGGKSYQVPLGFERNDMFLVEMRHFIGVVREKVAPLCTLEDGIQAMQIALTVHTSSSHDQRVSL